MLFEICSLEKPANYCINITIIIIIIIMLLIGYVH